MRTWKVLAGVSVVALLALVGLVAAIVFAGQPAPQTVVRGPGSTAWSYGGVMGDYGGMMGIGPMVGSGTMMGPGFAGSPEVAPLSVEEARAAVDTYLTRLGDSNLAVREVMVFTNQAYAQVVEKSSGIGAFEVLVDPVTRAVTPEPGPNMMWNLSYGRMSGLGGFGMMGGMGGMGMRGGSYGMGMGGVGMGGGGLASPEPLAEMPVGPEEAIDTAQRYLDAYLPGSRAGDEADPFYGYYTVHVARDGDTVGMLSVNGYTQDVFVHLWHGDFVDIAEYDHE